MSKFNVCEKMRIQRGRGKSCDSLRNICARCLDRNIIVLLKVDSRSLLGRIVCYSEKLSFQTRIWGPGNMLPITPSTFTRGTPTVPSSTISTTLVVQRTLRAWSGILPSVGARVKRRSRSPFIRLTLNVTVEKSDLPYEVVNRFFQLTFPLGWEQKPTERSLWNNSHHLLEERHAERWHSGLRRVVPASWPSYAVGCTQPSDWSCWVLHQHELTHSDRRCSFSL